MASRRKRRIRAEDGDEEIAIVRRPRRRVRRLLVLLLLAVVVVVAGPTIVSSTPLRNTLLGLSMPVEGLRVESQAGSFAWLSGQSIANVSIADRAGNPLLTAESISVDRSLWSLISGQSGSLKLTVVRPIVSLATREGSSNLEDVFAAWNSSPSPDDSEAGGGEKLNLTVEIIGGNIRGYDAETQQQWLLSEVNVATHSVDADKVEVNGDAKLSISPEIQPGRVKFHLLQTAGQPQQLDVLTEQLPLEPFEPWLRRVLPGTRLAGMVSADAKFSWTSDAQGKATLQSSGRLDASGVDFTAEILSGDHLRFERLEMPWRLTTNREGITIELLEAKTEWASFLAKGLLSFEELRSLKFENLPKQPTEFAARVQLDRLAAMLPQTLQLREGLEIDSGELEITASGQEQDKGFGWSAALTAEGLAGTDGHRQIRWEKPIEVTLDLVDSGRGPQLIELAISAPFVEGTFATTDEKVDGSFRLDLEQFATELGQFVDFGAWQFRGQGEGDLSLTRQPNDGFEATATINLTGLNVGKAGVLLWSEQRLNAVLAAQGVAQGFEVQQLVTGSLNLNGISDRLQVALLEPIVFGLANPAYKIRVEGNGPLALWAGRLRPWIASVPAEMEGEAYVKATLQVAGDTIHVLESEGSVAQLRVRSEALMIDEPRVQFAGDCLWDAASSKLVTQELQLVGSSMALRSRDIAVQLSSEATPTATGQIAFRGDLERLASIAGLVRQQDATWPRGMATGTMELSSNAQHLLVDLEAKVEQLQLVRTSETSRGGNPELVWAEPELIVAGQATYLIADDRLQIENVRVDGKTLQLSGRSTLDKPSTKQQLQADGMLQYDSAELAKLLASYLGPEVQVYGDRQIRFQVTGRLSQVESAAVPLHWSQRFNVTADAGWTSAAVYGLPIGTGRLQGTIAGGQLQIAPLDVAVGQGRLKTSLRGILAPEPAYLQLPKGVLLSSVDISPQVSETMLKYVAPIVAGATRTEGKFSLDLEETQIPLADPRQARVSGRLTVHRLNVTPGPMMADLIRIVKQIEALSERRQLLQAVGSSGGSSLLSIDNRQIEFQVAEGRVYHRNLEFLVDNVPVRSRGSVGFDQSLALTIEIPIQDKWIEKERALRSLAGQSIQIPVQGTFQNPRIDERAVANLSRQLLQGVATEAIGGEINKALDKLFKSR